MAQLPFLAIGRVEDSTTLASFCPDTIEQAQQRDTEDVFKKLLTAAGKKLRHGEKTRLQWNDGSVCCLMDNNKVLLYCVVTSDLQYPERLAYGMLVDLMKIVDRVQRDQGVDLPTAQENKLTPHIRTEMQALTEKYEDSKQWQGLMDALNQVSSAQASPMNANDTAVRVNKDPNMNMQARPQGGGSNGFWPGIFVSFFCIACGIYLIMRGGSDSDNTTAAPAPAPAPIPVAVTDAAAVLAAELPAARWSESVLV